MDASSSTSKRKRSTTAPASSLPLREQYTESIADTLEYQQNLPEDDAESPSKRLALDEDILRHVNDADRDAWREMTSTTPLEDDEDEHDIFEDFRLPLFNPDGVPFDVDNHPSQSTNFNQGGDDGFGDFVFSGFGSLATEVDPVNDADALAAFEANLDLEQNLPTYAGDFLMPPIPFFPLFGNPLTQYPPSENAGIMGNTNSQFQQAQVPAAGSVDTEMQGNGNEGEGLQEGYSSDSPLSELDEESDQDKDNVSNCSLTNGNGTDAYYSYPLWPPMTMINVQEEIEPRWEAAKIIAGYHDPRFTDPPAGLTAEGFCTSYPNHVDKHFLDHFIVKLVTANMIVGWLPDQFKQALVNSGICKNPMNMYHKRMVHRRVVLGPDGMRWIEWSPHFLSLPNERSWSNHVKRKRSVGQAKGRDADKWLADRAKEPHNKKVKLELARTRRAVKKTKPKPAQTKQRKKEEEEKEEETEQEEVEEQSAEEVEEEQEDDDEDGDETEVETEDE